MSECSCSEGHALLCSIHAEEAMRLMNLLHEQRKRVEGVSDESN